MAWEQELAKAIKATGKRQEISPQIGEVISLSPLKIAVFQNTVTLEGSLLYRCRALEHTQLIIGDKVLCIPIGAYKSFVIVDKVMR